MAAVRAASVVRQRLSIFSRRGAPSRAQPETGDLSRFEVYAAQMRRTTLSSSVIQKLHQSAEIKHKFYARRRHEDTAMALALFGIAVMCVEVLHSETAGTACAKALVSLSTALLLATLVARYQTEVALQRLQHRLPASATLWSTWRLLRGLLLELLVCGYHIPPGMDFVVRMSSAVPAHAFHVDILGFFMWARLYMLASVVRNHSGYYSQQTALVGAWNGVDALSVAFHVKCLFKDRPQWVLGPLLTLSLAVTSLSVFVVEREANPAVSSFGDAAWLTIVTVSSVGYGDKVPVTSIGRTLTAVGGIAGGVLLLALLTTALVAGVELSPEERKVLRYVSHSRWQRAELARAATLIQRAFRVYRAGGFEAVRGSPALDRLFQAKNAFCRVRGAEPDVAHETPEALLQRIETRVANLERQREVGMAALEAQVVRLAVAVEGLGPPSGKGKAQGGDKKRRRRRRKKEA